ncbi:MAG: hypothetical protein HC880_04010 [Bacteroidia bacterium]|nr:hypothetical protein [Bacteroidia bacterium]
MPSNTDYTVTVRKTNATACTAVSNATTPDCTPSQNTLTLSPIHDAYLDRSNRVNNDLIRIEQNRRTSTYSLTSAKSTVPSYRLS